MKGRSPSEVIPVKRSAEPGTNGNPGRREAEGVHPTSAVMPAKAGIQYPPERVGLRNQAPLSEGARGSAEV